MERVGVGMKKHSVNWLSWGLWPLTAFLMSSTGHSAVPKNLNTFPEGERLVYTRLVQAFRTSKLDEVIKQRQVLERNYPHSVHLDNAYFLTGTLLFQKENYAEALKAFSVVRQKYIKSNKRPAAMYGMAMTYQKLNLAHQAQRVLQKIMTEYPGSPESQRAYMSLRMDSQVGKTPSVKR